MKALLAALVRAQYAVEEDNGEFLGDLTRPIPYTTSNSKVREDILAVFPTGGYCPRCGRRAHA